jgi:DNA polymerase II
VGDRGYLVHAWTHRGRIRLAGRLENGESFAAILSRRSPLRFASDPAGRWESFEGERQSVVGEGPNGAAGRDTGIPPAEEFLLLHAIRGTLTLRGDSRPGRRVSRVFSDPVIAPSDHQPVVVWAALDIETDPGGTVTAISLVCGKRDVIFFRDDSGSRPPRGDTATPANLPSPIRKFATEREMLTAFASTLREWDPDVITGWNVVAFDFAVLARRFEATGVPFDLSRAEDELSRVGTASARSGWVTVPGRQVVDAMRILRGSGRTFTDMRLDTVAQEVLGRGKTVSSTGEEKLAELERLRREDPVAFCRYCLEDSRLVLAILAETGLDALTLIRANLTGLPFDRAWTSIPAFERIYALELIRRRILPPRGERGAVTNLPEDYFASPGLATRKSSRNDEHSLSPEKNTVPTWWRRSGDRHRPPSVPGDSVVS